MVVSAPAPRCAAAGLLLAGLFSAPASVWAQTVRSPAPGVLCDALGLRRSGVCYDSNGASVPLTGRYLGPRAEAQLRAYLADNPAPREFRLSDGTVCSVPQRTCWEDGWSRRNVAQKLSRQLFTTSASGSDSTASTPAESSRVTGLCSLSRAGRAVFDGPCDLRQINRGDGVSRYRVRLNNGTTYVFTNRSGSFSIADNFGSTWPVSHVNHGVTGIFRWGDMNLVATQTVARGALGEASAAPSGQQDLGRALGSLLNTLFR
ncbi:MAG: hypothetical protein FJ083_07480 [Cyanobacteria bacterium K_Offshore_surface_m2_239]|nr:hypothetical protein [Cyanobacteria bacterium K_Offshore_surface_m2_239]